MKQKIVAAIKPLVADRGLKAKEIENLADFYITLKGFSDAATDDELNDAVKADSSILKTYAANLQSAISSADTAATARTEAKFKDWIDPKKAKELLKGGENTGSGNEGNKPEPQGISPELKAYLDNIQKAFDEQQKRLQQVDEQQKARAAADEANRLNSLLQNDSRVKDLPKWFSKHYTLDKEENLETTAAQIEKDWTEAKQELYKRSGEFAEPPGNGGGGSDADDFMRSLENAAKKATTKK
jgi:hypothetical protein